jgi:hypothetical protein
MVMEKPISAPPSDSAAAWLPCRISHLVERRHPRVGFEEHRQQHGGQQQVDQIV